MEEGDRKIPQGVRPRKLEISSTASLPSCSGVFCHYQQQTITETLMQPRCTMIDETPMFYFQGSLLNKSGAQPATPGRSGRFEDPTAGARPAERVPSGKRPAEAERLSVFQIRSSFCCFYRKNNRYHLEDIGNQQTWEFPASLRR